MLSTSEQHDMKPLHVAMVMDGNGRWAKRRGWARPVGHKKGSETARTIIESAAQMEIDELTLYAFSSDNWKRPMTEVSAIMKLFKNYLKSEIKTCLKNGVRLEIIGRRDRLSNSIIQLIEYAEKTTEHGQNLHLRLAIDYSSRYCIQNQLPLIPDVDVLIRTGGEKRLSDFLLWESAYAELFFIDTLWPDFSVEHLTAILSEFYQRDRRFGEVKENVKAS